MSNDEKADQGSVVVVNQAHPTEFVLRRTQDGRLQMFVDGVDLLAHHRIRDLDVRIKENGRLLDYTINGARLLASPAAKP